jgi:XTP/dITP diphosphohydrolase
MTQPLLIATTNPGKLREVRAILAGVDVPLETLSDHPAIQAPVEDADTFEENARLKANYYAQATGRWTLADDSGLEVDALNGEPGVRSARYAGTEASDEANNRKLLERLADVPLRARTARFRCCVALASPEGVVATAVGTVEGRILDEPRGCNGFGYDPLFWIEHRGMTSAEMPPKLKNRISHRGRALRAIRPAVLRYVRGGSTPDAG